MSALTYSAGGGSDESRQTLTYNVTVLPTCITVWLADCLTQETANTAIYPLSLHDALPISVADSNGSGSLTWTVQDSGGTTNGGVDTLTETLGIRVDEHKYVLQR